MSLPAPPKLSSVTRPRKYGYGSCNVRTAAINDHINQNQEMFNRSMSENRRSNDNKVRSANIRRFSLTFNRDHELITASHFDEFGITVGSCKSAASKYRVAVRIVFRNTATECGRNYRSQ